MLNKPLFLVVLVFFFGTLIVQGQDYDYNLDISVSHAEIIDGNLLVEVGANKTTLVPTGQFAFSFLNENSEQIATAEFPEIFVFAGESLRLFTGDVSMMQNAVGLDVTFEDSFEDFTELTNVSLLNIARPETDDSFTFDAVREPIESDEIDWLLCDQIPSDESSMSFAFFDDRGQTLTVGSASHIRQEAWSAGFCFADDSSEGDRRLIGYNDAGQIVSDTFLPVSGCVNTPAEPTTYVLASEISASMDEVVLDYLVSSPLNIEQPAQLIAGQCWEPEASHLLIEVEQIAHETVVSSVQTNQAYLYNLAEYVFVQSDYDMWFVNGNEVRDTLSGAGDGYTGCLPNQYDFIVLTTDADNALRSSLAAVDLDYVNTPSVSVNASNCNK